MNTVQYLSKSITQLQQSDVDQRRGRCVRHTGFLGCTPTPVQLLVTESVEFSLIPNTRIGSTVQYVGGE